jgi:endonuclease/exonuclease/phosphatase family metal-dependent hydrolase
MSLLRVATFNIRHGRALGGALRLERTAKVIRALEADVVALQEVDRGLVRSGRTDQVAVLGELTGMSFGFGPTLRRSRGSFGIALGATHPVDGRFELLAPEAGRRRHGVLTATLGGVTLAATHLSTQARARSLELEALAKIIGVLPGTVIVAGDLNAPARSLQPLAGLGLRGRRRGTWPSWLPLWQRDHVLVGPGARIASARTMRTAASDHLPLVCEIEVCGRRV